MSIGRLRAGELLVALGAVALVALLFLDWFAVDRSGWSTLGWPTDALIVLSVGIALWMLVCTATARLVSITLVAGVLTTFMATATVVVIAWRVFVDPPGLAHVPDDDVTLATPAWLGLAAAVLLAAGAWWSLRDERTGARDSAVVPPAPRPAPPA